MTATPEQDHTAAQAVTAGMAAAAAHETAAQAQHRTTAGSDVAVEAAATPDDTAVQWTQPHGIVSGPTPDNSGENRGPNVSTPYDNTQSQPR
jgi:hypothetical protein